MSIPPHALGAGIIIKACTISLCYGFSIFFSEVRILMRVETVMIIRRNKKKVYEIPARIKVNILLILNKFLHWAPIFQFSSTLIPPLFSFDQDMRVEKTLIQTLTCQLSSTVLQLLSSFDQDMRVEKTPIQTLSCKFSSTLMQLLFSVDQNMRVEKTVIQTLTSQLSCNSGLV